MAKKKPSGKKPVKKKAAKKIVEKTVLRQIRITADTAREFPSDKYGALICADESLTNPTAITTPIIIYLQFWKGFVTNRIQVDALVWSTNSDGFASTTNIVYDYDSTNKILIIGVNSAGSSSTRNSFSGSGYFDEADQSGQLTIKIKRGNTTGGDHTLSYPNPFIKNR